jgi:hypothetical protein
VLSSRQLKAEGMEKAATAKTTELAVARELAVSLARQKPTRTLHMDELRTTLDILGIELGPAAGSVFRGDDWEFTGQRVESEHGSNHARELKVWRLIRYDYV